MRSHRHAPKAFVSVVFLITFFTACSNPLASPGVRSVALRFDLSAAHQSRELFPIPDSYLVVSLEGPQSYEQTIELNEAFPELTATPSPSQSPAPSASPAAPSTTASFDAVEYGTYTVTVDHYVRAANLDHVYGLERDVLILKGTGSVTVNSAEAALDVELAMVTATVSGRLVAPNGDPLPGLTVSSPPSFTATTDTDGRFSLELPTGPRELSASGSGWALAARIVQLYDDTPVNLGDLTASVPDTIPPVAAGSLSASNISYTGFDILFPAATDTITPENQLEYHVRIDTTDFSSDPAIAITEGLSYTPWFTAPTGDTVNISSRTPNTTYYVAVFVKDLAGNIAKFATLPVDTLADSTLPALSVDTLTISNRSTSGFRVDWTPATDNVTPQANLSYRVMWRSDAIPGSYGDGTIAMDWTPAASSCDFTGLAQGSTVYFRVFVRDDANNISNYVGNSVTTMTSIVYPCTSVTLNSPVQNFSLNFATGVIPANALVHLKLTVTANASLDNRDYIMANGIQILTTGNAGPVYTPPASVDLDISNYVRGFDLSGGDLIYSANAWSSNLRAALMYGTLTFSQIDLEVTQ